MEQKEEGLQFRRLLPEDAAAVRALYAQDGRDGAWYGAETLTELWETGEWQGAFVENALCFCAARVAADSPLKQAERIRNAHAPGASPEALVLPPAFHHEKGLSERVIAPVLRALCTRAHGTGVSRLLAATPVKGGAALLAGCCAAGFAAVCARPLESLRPHYLLRPRGECSLRKDASPVYLPLADTLNISRLLERGWVLTGVRRLAGDERPMAELRRTGPIS